MLCCATLFHVCVLLQGIGRTGTFCSVDILVQRLDAWASCSNGKGPDQAEVEDTLDVPALVHKLRAQRMGMVQVRVVPVAW